MRTVGQVLLTLALVGVALAGGSWAGGATPGAATPDVGSGGPVAGVVGDQGVPPAPTRAALSSTRSISSVPQAPDEIPDRTGAPAGAADQGAVDTDASFVTAQQADVDIVLNQEFRLTPDRPGHVTVTNNYSLADRIVGVDTAIPRRARVTDTNGFAAVNETTFTWDGRTANPSVTYSLPVNETGRRSHEAANGSLLFADVGEWALFARPATNTRWRAVGTDPVALDRRTVTVGPGAAGEWLVYLGDVRLYPRTTDNGTFRLAVPAAADMEESPDDVLDALERAAADVDVGDRDEAVFALAAPTDGVPWAVRGLTTGDADFWVGADESLATTDNLWIHEYLHTRQDYLPTNATLWTKEGFASYYAARHALEYQPVTFREFADAMALDGVPANATMPGANATAGNGTIADGNATTANGTMADGNVTSGNGTTADGNATAGNGTTGDGNATTGNGTSADGNATAGADGSTAAGNASAGPVLSNPSSWETMTDYERGALVAAQLDRRIRLASGGNRSIDAVFAAMNDDADRLNGTEFFAAVETAGGNRTREAIASAVRTDRPVRMWNRSQHVAAFGSLPARFRYGLPDGTQPLDYQVSGPYRNASLNGASSLTIATGETLSIRAHVTNVGGDAGFYDVALRANDAVVDAADGRLAANSSRSVLLSHQFTTPGSYTIGVGEDTTTVMVVRPARADIASVVVTPGSIPQYGSATVAVTVRNDASIPAERTVTVRHGEDAVTRSVAVAPGSTTTATIDLRFPTAGRSEIVVDDVGSLTVNVEPRDEPNQPSIPTTTAATEGVTGALGQGLGSLVALFALVAAALFVAALRRY